MANNNIPLRVLVFFTYLERQSACSCAAVKEQRKLPKGLGRPSPATKFGSEQLVHPRKTRFSVQKKTSMSDVIFLHCSYKPVTPPAFYFFSPSAALKINEVHDLIYKI